MTSLFDDLKEGLQEAIDYEKGAGTAIKTVSEISHSKKNSKDEIKECKNIAGRAHDNK